MQPLVPGLPFAYLLGESFTDIFHAVNHQEHVVAHLFLLDLKVRHADTELLEAGVQTVVGTVLVAHGHQELRGRAEVP